MLQQKTGKSDRISSEGMFSTDFVIFVVRFMFFLVFLGYFEYFG